MSDFLTEIPANCLFNKKQTGCGATELAIRNSIPTIIAMPYVALVKNKTIYRKDDISVLGVYEGIQEQDIIDYAKSHCCKNRKIFETPYCQDIFSAFSEILCRVCDNL